MSVFAIMDNVKGVREDVPHIKIHRAFSTESENVFLHHGKAKRMQGRAKVLTDANGTKVPTPDGNPAIHYHTHYDEVNGIEYLFAFTKAHIYQWVPSTYSFAVRFTCSSDCTLWDTARLGSRVIATNGVDKVLFWDDTSLGNFAALDNATNGIEYSTGKYLTAAKYVKVYENYLFLGFTTEDGTVYPYRRRWCSRTDSTDWDDGGSGDAGYNDFLDQGAIKGFGKYTANAANLFVTFMKGGTKGAIHISWLTTADTVFENDQLSTRLGLLATHSVVNDKEGNCYFIGTDYAVHRLFSTNPISDAVDVTIKNINQDYEAHIESTFIDSYNHIWWSVPSSAGSTGNDLILAYDLNIKDMDVWYPLPFNSGTRAFGTYTQQFTFTIDTLDTVYSSINEIGYDTIDDVKIITGFPLDIASDYSGETWSLHTSENDAGSSFTATLVLSTDLSDKQTLGFYKRINEGLFAFYEAEGTNDYTVAHTYKREDDASWQILGSTNLNGTGRTVRKHLPLDIRSRDFLLRQQATNRFSFLGFYFNGFVFEGDR